MNTKFILSIFVFLTGTVLAQDVPPVVREVLTQEELHNVQERKVPLTGIKKEGDAQVVIEDLGNNENKDEVSALKGQAFFKRHPFLTTIIVFYALVVPRCFMYGWNEASRVSGMRDKKKVTGRRCGGSSEAFAKNLATLKQEKI